MDNINIRNQPKITKLLVSARGEIAVRIIRAARDAGIVSVAVYADQDANAKHVRLADEAYALHGMSAAETYLVSEKLLSIARRSGANAVHPGYGFLSENADFAQEVTDAGLIWIGPPPQVIALLGNKVGARQVAQKVSAPLAAGTMDPVENIDEALTFIDKHGLPVVIKAIFGGGGRGMKVVRERTELVELFESAAREAMSNYGRGECFIERYLEKPRHVETQCLADIHGNVAVISTRDCSVQRRHQKLVEEAPAPFLTKEQEAVLYESSKAILREVGYVGAGTCEFLLAVDGTISFLEVNTRLQVEHPVSEQVTGIDLVREQFRIAEGEALGYTDPPRSGHALEFRINGEDAGNGFLPGPGTIKTFKEPTGPGVRVDSGVESGDIVTGAYDSLLAKLIVTGSDRAEALQRARRALDEFEVTGLATVLPFHRHLVRDEIFTAENGDFGVYTQWVDTDYDNQIPAWNGESATATDTPPRLNVVVEVNDKRIEVSLPERLLLAASPSHGGVGRTMAGRPPRRKNASKIVASTGNEITAPMQATVIKIAVEEGQQVSEGDLLMVLEAMKMEQPIYANKAGEVADIVYAVGETVATNAVLMQIS